MSLQSRYEGPAEGVILESHVDKKYGMLSLLVIKQGKLRTGDIVIAGSAWGRVKKLFSTSMKVVKEALPSMPVIVSIVV